MTELTKIMQNADEGCLLIVVYTNTAGHSFNSSQLITCMLIHMYIHKNIHEHIHTGTITRACTPIHIRTHDLFILFLSFLCLFLSFSLTLFLLLFLFFFLFNFFFIALSLSVSNLHFYFSFFFICLFFPFCLFSYLSFSRFISCFSFPFLSLSLYVSLSLSLSLLPFYSSTMQLDIHSCRSMALSSSPVFSLLLSFCYVAKIDIRAINLGFRVKTSKSLLIKQYFRHVHLTIPCQRNITCTRRENVFRNEDSRTFILCMTLRDV